MTSAADNARASLHAIFSKDLSADRPWIYCAGKISHLDWRVDLFDAGDRSCIGGYGWEGDSPHFKGLGNGGYHPQWRYAGPFFISCDHSCGHGATSHGCGCDDMEDLERFGTLRSDTGCLTSAPSRRDVIKAALHGIRAADVVFAWLDHDFDTAHGTMAEIGYAAALRKPLYSARSPTARNAIEAWFPIGLTRSLGVQPDVGTALATLVTIYERQHPMTIRPEDRRPILVSQPAKTT